MTDAYLNLPGHCFVNEINVIESIDSESTDNNTTGIDKTDSLHDQPPAYHTHNLNTDGIQLTPDLLSAFGFTAEHNISLFITHGRIVITTDPARLVLINAIAELQLRQDEINTDFTVAIEALKGEI